MYHEEVFQMGTGTIDLIVDIATLIVVLVILFRR